MLKNNMPDQICSINDLTCELCRQGRPRPHQYKKWVARTDYCDVVQEDKSLEDIKIPEENLPF
jgi:hypothetical protein